MAGTSKLLAHSRQLRLPTTPRLASSGTSCGRQSCSIRCSNRSPSWDGVWPQRRLCDQLGSACEARSSIRLHIAFLLGCTRRQQSCALLAATSRHSLADLLRTSMLLWRLMGTSGLCC